MIWDIIFGAMVVIIWHVRFPEMILIYAMGANETQIIIYRHQNSNPEIYTVVSIKKRKRI